MTDRDICKILKATNCLILRAMWCIADAHSAYDYAGDVCEDGSRKAMRIACVFFPGATIWLAVLEVWCRTYYNLALNFVDVFALLV